MLCKYKVLLEQSYRDPNTVIEISIRRYFTVPKVFAYYKDGNSRYPRKLTVFRHPQGIVLEKTCVLAKILPIIK